MKIETVRYYEQQGLIISPPRSESGYRQYSEEMVDRVRFVKKAQGIGFTLKEIARLFALRVESETNCAEIKMRAEEKIADIEEKILGLQRMKVVLTELASSCSGSGSASECPILNGLDAK